MHKCSALGCEEQVPLKYLMCRKHWFLVPAPLQSAVWGAYRVGQERDKSLLTEKYFKAAFAAIRAVANYEGVTIPKAYYEYEPELLPKDAE